MLPGPRGMLYGMRASGDTQLSSVMRAINDDPEKCLAVEKRLKGRNEISTVYFAISLVSAYLCVLCGSRRKFNCRI